MKKPERIDLFEVGQKSSLAFGYHRLSKDKPSYSIHLPELVVLKEPKEMLDSSIDYVVDSNLYASIEEGDIGLVTQQQKIRVILSRKANHNTLLLTERCDNLCLFCSQPPKDREDSWLLTGAELAIKEFNFKGTIGLSGGEPLLHGDDLVAMLKRLTTECPETSFHILSNGRGFANSNIAKSIGEIAKDGKVVFGIPLYSTNGQIHDDCVGAQGAFQETLLGLINAGNSGIPIEIRIIPLKQNYTELDSIVELVGRCVSSISQISIMNLEPTGWAKHNWKDLYQSPSKYERNLQKAVVTSELIGLNLVLFNYPLCHLPAGIRHKAVKSISDWKNFYPDECDNCLEKYTCGGYFISTGGERFDPPRSIQ